MGFKSTYQKKFNQKIHLWKNVAVTAVYFCYENVSKNRKNLTG